MAREQLYVPANGNEREGNLGPALCPSRPHPRPRIGCPLRTPFRVAAPPGGLRSRGGALARVARGPARKGPAARRKQRRGERGRGPGSPRRSSTAAVDSATRPRPEGAGEALGRAGAITEVRSRGAAQLLPRRPKTPRPLGAERPLLPRPLGSRAETRRAEVWSDPGREAAAAFSCPTAPLLLLPGRGVLPCRRTAPGRPFRPRGGSVRPPCGPVAVGGRPGPFCPSASPPSRHLRSL